MTIGKSCSKRVEYLSTLVKVLSTWKRSDEIGRKPINLEEVTVSQPRPSNLLDIMDSTRPEGDDVYILVRRA